jgi:hypothetical protein
MAFLLNTKYVLRRRGGWHLGVPGMSVLEAMHDAVSCVCSDVGLYGRTHTYELLLEYNECDGALVEPLDGYLGEHVADAPSFYIWKRFTDRKFVAGPPPGLWMRHQAITVYANHHRGIGKLFSVVLVEAT